MRTSAPAARLLYGRMSHEREARTEDEAGAEASLYPGFAESRQASQEPRVARCSGTESVRRRRREVKALIVIDMLEDFVTGRLANARAERIVEPLRRLLAHARAAGWVVVFSNDAHRPGDPELRVWGEHAMAGEPGAQVIAALQPRPGEREFVCPKRGYGAFDGTCLGACLRSLDVDEVVLAGQHTHICVRHSAYGAFIRGYTITVPRDAVCAFEGVDEEEALEYLRSVYGASITCVDELLHEATAVAA
jgi:nicotinamidase-related amidase